MWLRAKNQCVVVTEGSFDARIALVYLVVNLSRTE